MIFKVALGNETHLADVALERLLTLVLYPDVLVNTGTKKIILSEFLELDLEKSIKGLRRETSNFIQFQTV